MSIPSTNLRIGVIMAGGSGERFWPLSRQKRPKQLLKLSGENGTLLEEAVNRLLPLIPPDHLFIATSLQLRDPICRAGLGVPPENVLAEPCKRNTAGCLAYATAHCLHRFGDQARDCSLVITTADHRIGEPDRFLQTVTAALEAVEREPVLAVVGVEPTRPETGFGYIEITRDAMQSKKSAEGPPVYPVERFREKPNRETAEDLIAEGRFFWNSGMFFWRVSTFLAELEHAQPTMVHAIHKMAAALNRNDDADLRSVFGSLEDISIDYALMEHARRVVMVPAGFPWDDIGAWDALDRTGLSDDRGNIAVGDPVLLDSSDCLVYNDPGPERMAVGVVGVEGLVVVVSQDGVLVIPKERAQDVRQVVAELKRRGAAQL